MHKRIRVQKMIIMVLAMLVSIIIMSVLFGRMQTIKVLVVDKEISLNKPLGEQKSSFREEQISKSDFKNLGGKLVTDFKQLEKKHLQYKLEKNSPIPLSLLGDTMVAGEYAANLSKNYTTFKIVDGVSALPAGVVPGDRLNIAITYDVEGIKINEITQEPEKVVVKTTLMVLRDILVQDIDEKNVHVKVTEQEHIKLSNFGEKGKFVLQLPGKKDQATCEVMEELIVKEVELKIKEILTEMKEAKATEEEIEEATGDNAKAEMLQERLRNIDCVSEDQIGTISSENDIFDLVVRYEIESLISSIKKLQESNGRTFDYSYYNGTFDTIYGDKFSSKKANEFRDSLMKELEDLKGEIKMKNQGGANSTSDSGDYNSDDEELSSSEY